MRKTALFLALMFTALAPSAVICGAVAQPRSALVFDTLPADQTVAAPTVSTEDVEMVVGVLDMYMAPDVSNPITELVFNTVTESEVNEEIPEEEVPETEDTADKNTDKEYDGSAADVELDKGFVSSGTIDSATPILQKPSGTLAAGPFAPSKYKLTDAERDLVERVVMAEVSGRSYTDALAVAQCIYDRCMTGNQSVEEIIFAKHAFADPTYRYEPSAIVKDAVSDVFDDGARLTEEVLLYFYATSTAHPGAFHETQRCLVETSYHRYFGPW